MPSVLSYPGVYVEELPSGVRTIMGVATSIAAFVGPTRWGETDKAVTINNYGDYERRFGGLWSKSNVSYAVRDFFLNGGHEAIVVRVAGAGVAAATIDLAAFDLEARFSGSWGNDLQATIKIDASDDSLFELLIELTRSGVVVEQESYLGLSLKAAHAQRVDRVLASASRLVKVKEGFAPSDDKPKEEGPKKATADSGKDGDAPKSANFTEGRAKAKGLYALAKSDMFNLLCIPPYDGDKTVEQAVTTAAVDYCIERRAMLLVDPPASWTDAEAAVAHLSDVNTSSNYAAVFFPRLKQQDPLDDNKWKGFAPCGAVAGVIARTDAERGVWKAPAGLDAALLGSDLEIGLSNDEIGWLNPRGVNCLRTVPDAGSVVWGARTRQGADSLASQWKYLPVRRLALYIEESLFRGTQWVVFEPNDEPLWASIRLNVKAFMHSLFRQGAFQGASAREAYLVKCDAETTTQDDINRGIVNIVVGFAPLKPAEFVVIKLQQLVGQAQA